MRALLFTGLALMAACTPSAPPSNEMASNGDSGAADARAPFGALVDPASAGSATEAATRYAEAVSEGRLADAFAVLAAGSEAAEGGVARFAARFAGLREVEMTIGETGDPVDGEEIRIVEIPAVLTGLRGDGAPIRVEGPILLRVADESGTPDAPPRWEIVRSPFPN